MRVVGWERVKATEAIGAAEAKPFQPYLEYADKAGRVYHMNVRMVRSLEAWNGKRERIR